MCPWATHYRHYRTFWAIVAHFTLLAVRLVSTATLIPIASCGALFGLAAGRACGAYVAFVTSTATPIMCQLFLCAERT